MPVPPSHLPAAIPSKVSRPRVFALLWVAAVLVPLAGVVASGTLSWYELAQGRQARAPGGSEQGSADGAWWNGMLLTALGGGAAALVLLGLTGLASRTTARTDRAEARRHGAAVLHAASQAHDIGNLIQALRSGARLITRRADNPGEVRRCAQLLEDTAERMSHPEGGAMHTVAGGQASSRSPERMPERTAESSARSAAISPRIAASCSPTGSSSVEARP